MKVKESYDYLIKLIVIGDSGVGKTNIILRFSQDKFKDSYVATIGVDFKIKTIDVGDKKVRMQIWDTAGQQRFRTITETYYKGAAGILLVYSIDDRDSFQNLSTQYLYLEKWMMQIYEKTTPGIKIVMVANKSDLDDSERKVSHEEGMKLAEKYSQTDNVVQFFEVSAKKGFNIQQTFHAIAEQVKDALQQTSKAKSYVKLNGVNGNSKNQTDQECKC